MDAVSANEAKTQFGDLLLRVQRGPVLINRNGKPAAVMLSAEEYQSIELLKLQVLQARLDQAREDVGAGKTVDGEAFFDELETGRHD